jgi:hypothetical protein
MDLREKQLYYRYSYGWSYKEPPRLDNSIHRALREIDPRYRLIWAGVAVYREQEGGPVVGLRGDRDATKLLYGQLTARYIDARVKQFDGYSFKLAKSGREKRVMREDLIPRSKRKIAVAHFEYVHYGQLFWILEVYLTSEELIQTGYYQQDDPNLPTPGDYVHVLHLRGHDGLYREPDRE